MCRAIINEWGGRFGNNLQELANCCKYAFEDHDLYSISFPAHIYIKNTTLINPSTKDLCKCDRVVKTHGFFYEDDEFRKLTWNEKRRIVKKYLLPVISEKIMEGADTQLYDCCLHIRSGDVKSVTTGHYAKLPLDYYVSNIEEVLSKGQTVFICFEDLNIDVFKPLFELYGHHPFVFISYDNVLEKDMNTLMRCNRLITSVGSFSMAAVCLSKTIETVCIVSQRRKNRSFQDFSFLDKETLTTDLHTSVFKLSDEYES